MRTSRAITNGDVERILKEHPRLTEFGYDHPDVTQQAKVDSSREALLRQLPEIQAAHDWLLTLHFVPADKPWSTSYGLKHVGADSGELHYVTNGAMIVAAILAEAPMRIGRPNPAIGLSRTPPKPTPPPGSFTEWLMQHVDDQHPVGDLARDVRDDDTWPVEGIAVDDRQPAEPNSHQVYLQYLHQVRAGSEALDAFREAWSAYSGVEPPLEDEE